MTDNNNNDKGETVIKDEDGNYKFFFNIFFF